MSNIMLVNASCVDQDVDIIVNAANRFLLSGGGVCGAIFKRAGYKELNEACKKIKTPLKDGEAVITPAFNIDNCKYIIHAVGPDFGLTPNSFDKLYYAYYNSLLLLKEKNLHSISFPLISSGLFSGSLVKPAEASTKECLNAYRDFISNYPNYDIEVMLCAFSKEEYEEAKQLF